MRALGWTALALVLALGGCGNLKYLAIKGSSLTNPPLQPVKVYVKEFPVVSKASVVQPTAAASGGDFGSSLSGQATSSLAEAGNAVMVITRPSRIEDLTRSVLRELSREKIRVFKEWDDITDVEVARQTESPYELVPVTSTEAQLEISGRALIRSQRVAKAFSQKTTGVEIEVFIKDLATGKQVELQPMKTGIRMTFNSKELEEAMAVAVVTYMTQKTLF